MNGGSVDRSKKLTESDVVDYLMARGLGHLYKGAKEVAERHWRHLNG